MLIEGILRQRIMLPNVFADFPRYSLKQRCRVRGVYSTRVTVIWFLLYSIHTKKIK